MAEEKKVKKVETVEPVKENKSHNKIEDKVKANIDINDVLVKMIVTEKVAKLAGVQQEDGQMASNVSGRVLTFIVDKRATKIQIKQAVESMFVGFTVEKVRTMNYNGKLRIQGKSQGYTASYKKAYVTMVSKDGKENTNVYGFIING